MSRHPQVGLRLGAIRHRTRKLDGRRDTGWPVNLQVIEAHRNLGAERRDDLEPGADVHRPGRQLDGVLTAHRERTGKRDAKHGRRRCRFECDPAAVHRELPVARAQCAADPHHQLGLGRDLGQRRGEDGRAVELHGIDVDHRHRVQLGGR